MPPRSGLILTYTVLLLGVLPYVAAHGGGGENVDTGDHMAELAEQPEQPENKALSYFRHPDYWSRHLAHTVLMTLAWSICMPTALFLSVARSRYHLPAQMLFHIVNGLGVFAGFVYNRSTPNLYVNNAHHPLGWVVVAFTGTWTVISACVAYRTYGSGLALLSRRRPALTAQTVMQFEPSSPYNDIITPRDSRDSGQGTERNSASLFGSRQNSTDHMYQKPVGPQSELDFDDEKVEGEEPERQGFLGSGRNNQLLGNSVHGLSTERAMTAVRCTKNVLEMILLPLGFAALTSGFIVSGGLFRSRHIFSGLAHYIKGGIFVWYGMLTLGRWMGAFAEFGWAWNLKPQRPLVSKWKSMVPSAEFTESFVIWLYGATNIFLEHLNHWGDAWTPSDLEHLSITILFFGGGLLGMTLAGAEIADQRGKEPGTYRVPVNPMPALTIMLLGLVMSGHHQASVASTMMHAQWGALLSAFAVARAVTYVIIYLKPPNSHFPSRPPSEIAAAFCLTSGGFMLMNSAADIVGAIESNGFDAMTIFALTMGLTGIVLAWEVVLFAIQSWAVRKERADY